MTTPTDLLRAQLAEVAAQRAKAAELEASIKERQAAFSAAIADDVAALKLAKATADQRESEVKAMAIAHHDATPKDQRTKEPLPGLKLQYGTIYTYNAMEAFAWAKNAKMCVVPEALDVAAFEKVMKASPTSFPFVSVGEETRATLAKDLSAYLAAAPVPSDHAPLTDAETAEIPF